MVDDKLEKTVLSTMMFNPTAVETGLMSLDVDCFVSDWHRKVFEAIKKIAESNDIPDIILVAERSGVSYDEISMIMEYTVSSIESHCNRLKELKNIRQLYTMATKIQAMASSGEELSDMRDAVELGLDNCTSGDKKYEVQHIRESVSEVFEALEGSSGPQPIHLGFPDLDRVIGGVFPGEYVVIGARPGMGKTAFLLNAMMNISKSGGSCLMFSLEMKTRQLVNRYLSSEAEVNGNDIRNRKLKKRDFEALSNAASIVYNSNIYVNSAKDITVYDIKTIARRHIRKNPNTKVIAVDYLQLIADTKEYKNDRTGANTEKSKVLTQLADELNIPVIALAQLSRQCEMRPNKRPMPSDLKESGQIEQDAHIIAFLYRGFKYGDKYKDRKGNDVDYNENDVDVIISKNREGETGTVMLEFKGEYSKFYNIDVVHEEEEFYDSSEIPEW